MFRLGSEPWDFRVISREMRGLEENESVTVNDAR